MLEINQIYNEDCLVTMSHMPDNFIDLTVTSPPYDNLRMYNGFSFDFKNIAKELFRVTKLGGVVVWIVNDATIDGNETGTSFKQALYFKKFGFKLYDTMIYRKINKQPIKQPRYTPEFEYMFVLSKGLPNTINLIHEKCLNAGKINTGTARNASSDNLQKKHGYGLPCREQKPLGNIWSYVIGAEKDNSAIQHPAIFPEQLAKDHILSWSNIEDLIYDPFTGSGTVSKVAKLLHRNYIGSEISKAYTELAKERIGRAKKVKML